MLHVFYAAEYFTHSVGGNSRDIIDLSIRPDWCPLMDLPEKDNGDYPANTSDAGFVEGWNQCIDEITGGE